MTTEETFAKLREEFEQITEKERQQEYLERLESEWKNYQGEDKLVTSAELYEKIKTRPPEKKVLTGYAKLDDRLDGFRLKQLIVVSAATKSGKTSFCIELTSRMKDQNPCWLPFEESAEELIQKFIDREETPPYFVTPERMTGNTLSWVEKKIIEAKVKYNSKVLFIDHLHFIVDMGENMSTQIGKTMRELKTLAKKWDIIVVLIAHLKKTRLEEAPDLEDLRDSSFIAQEADTVIMLWRQTGKINNEVIISDNLIVSVQANRRTGKTGNIYMTFENGKFLEKDWRYKEGHEPEVQVNNYEHEANKLWKK